MSVKFFSMVVLSAGLSFVALNAAAEEPVQPNPAPEAKPADGPKKDPFSPSALMRMRAQKPVENNSSGVVVNPVAHSLPVFEGVLVKNNAVLASFRIGNRSIVIEPRNSFVADDINYTFIGYANEVATLRDEEGRIHDLRIVQHVSSNPPPRVPEPAATDK